MVQQGGLLDGIISTYCFLQKLFSTLYLVIRLVDQNSRGVHEWVLIIVTVPPAWRILSRAPCGFFNISHQFAAFFSIKYLYSVPTCVKGWLFLGKIVPFLALFATISKCNCDILERCTASILFTAKDIDFKNDMYMVVSPHDVQRINGTLFLTSWRNFWSKIANFWDVPLVHTHSFSYLWHIIN